MKRFKLTKGIKILLTTLLVIVVGLIIVGSVSNDKAMGYYGGQQCENYEECGGTIHLFSHTDTTHAWMCNRCWIPLEENPCNFNDYSNARVYPNNDGTHSWYALCTACGGLAPEPYTNGICADNNSDGRCDYCTGKTDNTGGSGGGSGGGTGGGSTGGACTCNGSTSYYSEYRVKDSTLHSCYFICNICGGEWYDADYIHYDNNGDGDCDGCGYTMSSGGGTHSCSSSSTTSIRKSQDKEGYHEYVSICTVCKSETVQRTEECIFEEFTDDGDGNHSSECGYCGNELVELHKYVNGVCTASGCGAKEPIKNIEITSTKYKIDGEYILNIQPGTEISKLKSNINTNATEINVYSSDGEVSDGFRLTTGMTIELKNGDLTKTFTIIVKGDVNEDGVADFKDLVTINKARLNKITLEEMNYLAADVNEDESLDLKDLSKINRFRLNKITEL